MGKAISTLVFRPPSPPTQLRSSNYFWLDTDDEGNQIPAFFVNYPDAHVTFLFSHGNAEDLGMMYYRMKSLARLLKVNIMTYEYTGYGLATGGPPNEHMCYKNIDAAYDHLTKVRKISPSQIVLYGRSLGSGPSCYLAAKTAEEGQSVAGLILHSPFLSVYRVVVDLGFTIAGDMFRNLDCAPKFRCPVLIIHGTKDEVVPFRHSQEFHSLISPKYRTKPFFAKGLGHNNIEIIVKNKYTERVLSFVDKFVPSNRGVVKNRKPPLTVPVRERAYINDLPQKNKNKNNSKLNLGIFCDSTTLLKDVVYCSSKGPTKVISAITKRGNVDSEKSKSKLSNIPFIFPQPSEEEKHCDSDYEFDNHNIKKVLTSSISYSSSSGSSHKTDKYFRSTCC